MKTEDFANLNQKLKQILNEGQLDTKVKGALTKDQVLDELKKMGYKPANLNSKAASKKLTPQDMQNTVVVGGARGSKHFVVVKDDGSWFMRLFSRGSGSPYGYGSLPEYTSKNSKLNQLYVYWMED